MSITQLDEGQLTDHSALRDLLPCLGGEMLTVSLKAALSANTSGSKKWRYMLPLDIGRTQSQQ